MSRPYQICARCIMDTSDPEIVFDDKGVCNHCHSYDSQAKALVWSDAERDAKLKQLIDKIKSEGKGREYDCIIGVSGGVDSTYVAHLCHQYGLRPLAVHLDNGWNSELAVENIKRTLDKLNIDLDTEVLDWEEFRDLQLSFLKASTPDSEIPTDHAIQALLMQRARKYKIRWILSGSNVRSEAILPRMWSNGIRDWRYIRSVQSQFGTQPLKTFPHFTLLDFILSRTLWRQQWVNVLNCIDYNKTEAMKVLQDELGWVYYGGKHYESIYTRFFQAYILPNKFNADKRRAHWASLICSGEVTRDQALEHMKEPICDPKLLIQDKQFVVKKLGISEEEFDRIMALPTKTIFDYPSYENSAWLKVLRAIYRLPRKLILARSR